MRVLFDGFWWAHGPASNRQVLREIIWAWAREFPEDDLVVAVPHASRPVARSELSVAITIVGTRCRPQGISAIVELPFIARKIHADVTVTHNFTPAFGASAVFIHDYMFLTSPEWFTLAELAYFRLMPLSARRARWLFTSSRTEAKRISRLSGGRSVTPVGLAVGSGLTDATARTPLGMAEDDGSFVLCVGRLNARKNLAITIEAALRSGRVSKGSPLIIVGEPQGRRADLPETIAAAVDDGIVRFLGFIDDGELSWLYRNTSLLLFLTLDEGFGLPVLEAMHFGAPLVVSDIPVFREILGARATYADPQDVSAIVDAIRAVELRSAGPGAGRRAEAEDLGYSWLSSVRAMRAAIGLPQPR